MKFTLYPLYFIAFFALVCMHSCTPSKTTLEKPFSLRADYLETPLGIDNEQPRLSWELKSGKDRRNIKQSAYEIVVTSENGDNYWSAKVNSANQNNIQYEGKRLLANTKYYWKVRSYNQNNIPSKWSRSTWFETGMLENKNWKAHWIFDGEKAPENPEDFYKEHPNPIFRKTFTAHKPIKKAQLYISGLGYYEAYLNGRKVGDHVLDPGWTNYDKEILYASYDITEQIQKGENVIGVSLGNGWYNPLPLELFAKHNLRKALTTGQPKVLAEIHLTFEDGFTKVIKTDESWKCSKGSVLKNNIYLGEKIDARLIQENWKTSDFNDIKWKQAVSASQPRGKLTAQLSPPIKITKKISPISITEPEPDVYVVDFGQNMAGWINMRLSGASGQKISFKYGEILHDDGMVNGLTTVAGHIKEMRNTSGGPGAPKTAYQKDTYILDGGGTETFRPHFTFHAFRYVEIRDYDKKPKLTDIVALRLNSDVEQAGVFACSNPLFNKIQEVVDWTFKSNIFSIQSDCPGRERFGYGGDIVTTADAFMYNYWMPNFYEKTVDDFANDQRSNGGVPEIAPYMGIALKGLGDGSGPVGWQLAYPFLLEKLYRFYGDTQIVEDQYAAVKRMIRHLTTSAGEDNFIELGIGDHVSLTEKNEPLTSTAFYYHHVKLAARFAELLNKEQDFLKYTSSAEKIKTSFIKRFYDSKTGQYGSKMSQANQTFALYYDLVPDGQQGKVLDLLLKDIHDNKKGHLSTGIFSTKMLFDVLQKYNQGNTAFEIVNQKGFPGYGHMLDKGATTLWETWTYPEQNSHNHPMFGSVSEWFFRSVLGINQAKNSVAFSKILIKPGVTEKLKWAKGSYKTLYGEILVDWDRNPEKFSLNVKIPSNTEAEIAISYNKNIPLISEKNGFEWQNAIKNKGDNSVSFSRKDGNYVYLKVGSGNYSFTAK